MRVTSVLSCSFFAWALSLPLSAAEPFSFAEVSAATGLKQHLEGDEKTRPWRYAHGAAWGDVDNDGRPDLFLGAFAARAWFNGDDAPLPNRLFLNQDGKLNPASDDTLTARAADSRCAGAAFLDLDNDRDLDLVVTNHVTKDQGGSRVFENLGAGKFRDVTPPGAPWNEVIGMRNVAGIDFNDDGLLDLVLTDGSYGRDAATTSRLRVLQNGGQFQFADMTADYGFPLDKTPGLGLALGDMNNDGRIDIFVAGSNRLFVSQAKGGKYREVENPALQYPLLDAREGLRCGAALADLDGDDLLDLVVTEHGVPTRLHVFRTTAIKDGIPRLADVSDAVGLGATFPSGTKEHPVKTAHVALRDLDNDSKIDILLAVITKDAKGNFQPVALRNLSAPGKPLTFSPPPFDAMYSYYAPGPVGDFDRDGRVDIFLPSWFEDVPNLLFKNTTPGGHWLTVAVRGADAKHNPQGIGAIVRAYEPGHVGDPQHQITRGDIVVGAGYASGEEALAHLGLGDHQEVDLRITWGAEHRDRPGVAVDRLLSVDFPVR
ncbi:MAG TPA: CRTAC1 family protein [Pirellulaceae bacterium]|nr:CRTAC1 family protein [Pirellulaceae bacterium]